MRERVAHSFEQHGTLASACAHLFTCRARISVPSGRRGASTDPVHPTSEEAYRTDSVISLGHR